MARPDDLMMRSHRTVPRTTRLVLVAGSLRRGSVNAAAIRAACRLAARTPGVESAEIMPLHPLPFFDGDVETAGVPIAVQAAREAIGRADAVVISTPSYNGAPPGVLKNALDWLSRPAGSSVLDGKVVATMSASPGRRGGEDAQHLLRGLLDRCGCSVVAHEPLVAIAGAAGKCGPDGELTDVTALAQIRRLVAATVAAARAAGAMALPGDVA